MTRTHAMRMPRALTGFRAGTAAAALGLLAACSPDNVVGNARLPVDVIDPAALHNAPGAIAAYRSAADLLRRGLNDHVLLSGLLGDELTTSEVGKGLGYTTLWEEYVDSRFPQLRSEAIGPSAYDPLNMTRGQVRQALGMLREYAPESSPALQGHLYAIDGYAKMMLAELYCSGIPLSEIVYKGDYRLEGASTTTQVLERALVSLDTAVAISSDSVRLLDLARVGRGRALLGLGRYAEAAEAVSAVPTGYAYMVQYPTDLLANFYRMAGSTWGYNVSDREGVNGLPFRSSGDPRVGVVQIYMGRYGPVYQPARHNTKGTSPIVMASGIEARLVEAEAALAAGGNWLTALNALRTNGTFTTRPNATKPGVTDTLWNAGGGAVAGLAPLADPGTPEARVDLLFRERAFWLHLTGHRLGDMRRLLRQYGRDASTVFPTGPYQAALGSYGPSVSLPTPLAETTLNPLYNGCVSQDA